MNFGAWCFLAAISLSTAVPSQAQTANSEQSITMDKAVNKAIANYPKIRAARLKVDQQETLKKTAWDLGTTQLFTGGEELNGEGDGVYTTVGIQQQNMNIFGVAPQLKAQKERIALAEKALTLSKLELIQQVKQVYAAAYVARKNLELYEQLDSIFQEFERAAKLRYEVEETSKLAYLASANQVKQITLQRSQAEYDYASALTKLNLWLVSDTLFTVDASASEWTKPLLLQDSLARHPLLEVAAQQVDIAEAERKAANAAFLPKLNAQYGIQEVAGEPGFYQFQLGVSIPLFFMQQQGQVQSSKIRSQIAEQEYRQAQIELRSSYQALVQQYQKWLASWQFYEEEALPLAREQREGAVLAYREGAIDYVSFIQNLKETVQVEVKAQEALNEYLDAKFQLEYYVSGQNPTR